MSSKGDISPSASDVEQGRIVEPIAIIGMAARIPEDEESGGDFWEMIKRGHSAASEIPRDRINMDAFYHPNADRSDTVRHPFQGHGIVIVYIDLILANGPDQCTKWTLPQGQYCRFRCPLLHHQTDRSGINGPSAANAVRSILSCARKRYASCPILKTM